MRVSKIIYFLLFNISLASYLPIAEAASCEANFNMNSSPGVLMFSTWRASQNLNENDAIAQVHKIAEKEGFAIGEQKKETGRIELVFFQKATSKSRSFQIIATADENLNTLTLIAALPPGMEAKPEDMRNAMCGMLAKVRLGEVGARNDSSGEPTASTSSKINVLQPKSIFDLGAAQAALEPGTSTIQGTACVVHHVENGGGTYLARNQSVSLFPATPYLKEVIQLSSKKGHDTLEVSPVAMQVRVDGMTNDKGQFQFSNLKPGKYYLLATMGLEIQGSTTKDLGTSFEGVNGRPTLTTYYRKEKFTSRFDDALEKFVEIEAPGQTVKVTLSPKSFFKGRAGIFGCLQ
ncbi:carboxypeptidase regulatory-like domain-containing protein [Xanthomonas hyacinthi]|uniref:carboxypeptidase regulatory-like domain-containing protein n=2 Tax=Xanthomonas hyacinthi TaxID=56455 RepID=UPI000A4E633A|nr:carboxypeptidase regulatory-like domain-containing protein [Xanthomonas hyacinthi]